MTVKEPDQGPDPISALADDAEKRRLREIGRRLRLVRGKEPQKAYANRLGVHSNTVGRYERGEHRIDQEYLRRVADDGDVRLDWLISGEEPMKRGGSASISVPVRASAAGYKSREGDRVYAPPPSTGISPADYVYIPRFDVSASAGPGLFADQEQVIDYMAFREDWVRRALGVDPTRLVLITAQGDSMEPTIRSGDLLLIDTSVDRILDDAIYVICRGGQLVVKRLQRFFRGAIAIRSDNPAYVDETLDAADLEDLRVAGRVRWIARMM